MSCESCADQGTAEDNDLFELAAKFGFQPGTPANEIQEQLQELEDQVRKEIQKELKIKESAENMRKLTTDRKAASGISEKIKECTIKLEELQKELHDLRTYQLMVGDTRASLMTTPNRGSQGLCHKCRLSDCAMDFAVICSDYSVFKLETCFCNCLISCWCTG